MTIEQRLEDGWRPAVTRERLWIRGRASSPEGDDRDVVETWDEDEPMSEAEERELIAYDYGIGDREADGIVVEPDDELSKAIEESDNG